MFNRDILSSKTQNVGKKHSFVFIGKTHEKNLFHIIIVVFCLLPVMALGDDGKCIEGDCVNGKGIYLFSNGDKYDGEFKNGEINGNGIYSY